MIHQIKQIATRNLISPYGLAFVSYALFLTAWVAPPALFLDYIGEPDLLYLNLTVFLFYSACVVCFMAGVWIFEHFCDSRKVPVLDLSCNSPLSFLLIPLAISTTLCIASVVVLNGNVSNVVELLFSQQGALLKLANASGQAEEGSWGYVITFQTGMLWWAYFRSKRLIGGGASQRIFSLALAVATIVAVITALIKVDRTNLIPILAGMLVILLYYKLAGKEVRMPRVAVITLATVALIVGSFVGVSYIRGASNAGILVAGVFGYTATSYNRLAAEISGLLHYSFGGRGIYLSTFLSYNNTINRIIPFNELMGSPTARGVYFSEFSSIAAGGLNPGFNWSGAFGYIFADLGWWTPIYLLAVGIFNGYLWRQFRRQSIAGIILYPWAAFSILFWFGWNVLFDLRFALLAVVVAIIGTYESRLLGRHASIDPEAEDPLPQRDLPPENIPGLRTCAPR
ncbi:MAG TPA: hypothetical protein VGD64_14865 [Acidisarcina sp.]